ncbi:hypothetical protein AJ80_08381 [Polytolypa hystricis UAMH7299]|uniref:Ams2/SPT21 N-terminal domain-containing protein n=1 Tax=Polytolypa hystricis (strain UAMH7299) TaxID=1447883 RepID=A0A2B7X857_POLH7|nr:hypothetical protein AJ80_08381 [Polytolypa hystricis UAMH7299]
MAAEDGISIRQMRLKVLYTFDTENKTNCLARWPHLLDIQTAFIDEETQVGVIELKTCIQAIVSASPELVVKLGRDYTIYAYDYSEYETPLVGQGMLSWVLASASPTPNAPAHQSKTMVTGRVCKSTFGLFSKGGQETLEVKLRLVPVPTVLQHEYVSSMQKYRESTAAPEDFDAQSWRSFVQENPGLLAANVPHRPAEQVNSPVDYAGIDRLHQMLSEGATPRELPNMSTGESFHADSPMLTHAVPSRTSTPGLGRPGSEHQKRTATDAFRPSSRASARSHGFQRAPSTYMSRRGSIASGYGSADEVPEPPGPKRAKLVRADWPDKADMNIERQPGSLRVAASTAASVRIHRPMPVNPLALAQASGDDPVRPPTPVPRSNTGPARSHPLQSNLRRESSYGTQNMLLSSTFDDGRETAVTSPEDVRYTHTADTPFHMPSSPPVVDSSMYPQTSSPLLPPLPDHDSGFMSGHLDSFLDDDLCRPTTAEPDADATTTRTKSRDASRSQPPNLPPQAAGYFNTFHMSDSVDPSANESAPTLPPRRATGSRPSSRASVRQSGKRLAPAPMSQSQAEQLYQSQTVPASDPVRPAQASRSQSQPWAGPMSDCAPATTANVTASTPTPASGLQPAEEAKIRSGAGARRSKQVQARLEQCIRQGTVPPYCENCGAIETPTWRRAWSKVMEGSTDQANSHSDDQGMLFWQPVDTDQDGTVTSFKIYKKSLAKEDNDFVQHLLCNPCGLWLHKFKSMRPENKWNKQPPKDKRKRARRGKLPDVGTATRAQCKALAAKQAESSPGPSDASSPPVQEEAARANETEDDTSKSAAEKSTAPTPRRANSAGPPNSADKHQNRWADEDPMEALRRAIQSSPARNMESRNLLPFSEPGLTPKPVRRSLFSSSKEETAMRTLSDALINGTRRSPSKTSKTSPDKENVSTPNDGLDDLFGTGNPSNLGGELPGSPSPKQKNSGVMGAADKAAVPTRPSTPPLSSTNDKVTSLTPSRLTSQELERASKGSSKKSTRAYRLNNLLKEDEFGLPPLGDTPCSRSFETIDGLVLDIFDSDDDSVAQTDSFYPFAQPKCPPSGNWGDWTHNNGDLSTEPQNGDGTVPHPNLTANNLENNKDKDTINNQTEPAQMTQAEQNEAEFRSLLFDTVNMGNDPNGEGAVDLALMDPDLFNMGQGGVNGTGSKDGDDAATQIDPEVISAIMRQHNFITTPATEK